MAVKGVGRQNDVSPADRAELERIVAATSSQVRTAQRAQIVFAVARGLTGAEISAAVGCSS